MRQSYSKPKVGRFLRHGVITRNSSEDQTANVNFFTTTPTTISTQCAPEATEFGEITQNIAITPFKVTQGHRFWYLPISD